MSIANIIRLIPEDSQDEALMSIQSITKFPETDSARLRCHLAHEFRIYLTYNKGLVTISAEGRADVSVPESSLIPALKEEIYEIDELIGSGRYKQVAPKQTIIMDPPFPPPEDFDIPKWDDEAQQWYDAEY